MALRYLTPRGQGDQSTGIKRDGGVMFYCEKCDLRVCHKCHSQELQKLEKCDLYVCHKCHSERLQKFVFKGTRNEISLNQMVIELQQLCEAYGIFHEHIKWK